MITIREDGFYQVTDHAHVPCVGIETDRLSDCIEGFSRNEFKGVYCSPYHRFSSSDLAFLSDLPWIEAVLLSDTNLADITGLYRLKNLKYLRGNAKRPPIDFSKLSSLKTLVIEPVSLDKGIESLSQLEKLHLRNYRPRTKDFSLLNIPKTVTNLQLDWVSFNSLEALPDLPNLKYLTIIHCKNLTDLNIQLDRFPLLEHIEVNSCIKLPEEDIERARKALSHLKHVRIEEGDEH